MNELDATWRFEVAIQDRSAARREPFRWGTALFNPDMPRVYDQNLLRVERGFDELTGRDLAAEADRLQRPAGLSHRKLVVPDEPAGRRLVPEFTELSWRHARHVVMAYRGQAPDPPPHPVRPVRSPDLRDARNRAFGGDLGGVASLQVTASLELIASVLERSRSFAVEVDGQPVSWCDLYEEGGIGQVEDVVTAVEHRRRGYGRAVVAAAVRASLESGNWLTYLVADDGDWPKDMYTRMGFEPIGFRYEFTRT